MVGQTNLLAKVDKFTIETIPHTLLFIGEYGSGRKTIIDHIAKRLNLPIVNINKIDKDWSEKVADNINSFRQDVVKKIYYLDVDNLTDKDQTKILKFIEEPGQNAFICLKAYNEAKILPTILNRCQIYRMEPYTKEQLEAVMWLSEVPNDIIFDICSTPAQIIEANTDDVMKFYDLSVKIVDKIAISSYQNFLSIYSTICAVDVDVFLFFKTLKYVAFNKYRDFNDKIAYIVYMITTEYTSLFNVSNLSTTRTMEHFIQNFLSKLWRTVEYESSRA